MMPTGPETHKPFGHSNRGTCQLALGVAILLLGAVLRLAAFDETLILEDQAAILDAAFQVASLNYFPIVGMKSSAGIMQTGVVPLISAIPLFFIKRVIAVQWFLSALDVLALAWFYRAIRKTFGSRAAIVAALLYAAAPWVVLYARTIWYQTLLATLATVTFAGNLHILGNSKPKTRFLVITMVSTTLMSMVHLAAAPWGLILFVYYTLMASREKIWRGYGFGLGVSLLFVFPYVFYLVHSSFADLTNILQKGWESQGLNTAAYRLSLELISGERIIANAHGDLWDRSIILWEAAPVMLLVLLGFAFLWSVHHMLRGYHWRLLLLFTIGWIFAVPSLYLRSDVHLQHFYLMMLFPAPYVLLGAWVEDLAAGAWRSYAGVFRKICAHLATGILILIALWWSSLWAVRIRLEAQGLLERTTRGWLMDQAAGVIGQYFHQQVDAQVIVLTNHTGDMSSFDWLRGRLQTDAVRVVAVEKGFVIPDAPTCYMLGPQVTEEALFPVISLAVEHPDMEIPAAPPWKMYCLASRVIPPVPLAEWDNGMRLVHSEITGELVPDGKLEIVHTWVYQSNAFGAYHFYNHLLSDGVLVAQVDGQGVPYWYWRDGDTLLTYFTLKLPATFPEGTYVLRTGMYTWPGLKRTLLVTGEDGYDAFTFN